MKIIITTNKGLMEKYNSDTVSKLNLVPIEKYEQNSTQFGGNLQQIAEISGTRILLMLGESHRTLGVAIAEDQIKTLSKEECTAFGIKYIEPAKEELPFSDVEVVAPTRLVNLELVEQTKVIPPKPVAKRNRSKRK